MFKFLKNLLHVTSGETVLPIVYQGNHMETPSTMVLSFKVLTVPPYIDVDISKLKEILILYRGFIPTGDIAVKVTPVYTHQNEFLLKLDVKPSRALELTEFFNANQDFFSSKVTYYEGLFSKLRYTLDELVLTVVQKDPKKLF